MRPAPGAVSLLSAGFGMLASLQYAAAPSTLCHGHMCSAWHSVLRASQHPDRHPSLHAASAVMTPAVPSCCDSVAARSLLAAAGGGKEQVEPESLDDALMLYVRGPTGVHMGGHGGLGAHHMHAGPRDIGGAIAAMRAAMSGLAVSMRKHAEAVVAMCRRYVLSCVAKVPAH